MTNDYYWVSTLAEGGLNDALKRLTPTDDPVVSLKLPETIFKGKLGHDVAELGNRVKVQSRWRKLSTVVMIAAGLERYINAVARLAVASDPALVPGFPKKLDGAYVKKHDLSLAVHDLRGLTTGDWSQRISVYQSAFGQVPAQLESNVGQLERLRKDRNKIAHALGVDDGFELNGGSIESVLEIALGSRRPETLTRVSVSDNRITSLMGTAYSVAEAIDQHLLKEFIGGYEILGLYLDWKKILMLSKNERK